MNDTDKHILETWLNTTYAFDAPVQVMLLRAYTNDVYLVITGEQRTILKCYGVTWRTEPEVQYEVALIDHLVQQGLPTSAVVRGKDGRAVYRFATEKGEQLAVLFEYADGEKPQPPFSNELYVAFGQAIGRMHNLSDDFVTTFPRKPLDLEFLMDATLKIALPLLDKADAEFLEQTAQTVKDKINRLNGLDWGVIHGDATLDNLHVTADNGIVLYDFDSGGFGWRAADVQGWAYNNAEYAERWEAFKQGYASIRELNPVDLEAAPYLAVAWLIWGFQIDLENRVLAQGEAKVSAYLAVQMSAIKEQAALAFR